jgi:FkbM family methyltransferase
MSSKKKWTKIKKNYQKAGLTYTIKQIFKGLTYIVTANLQELRNYRPNSWIKTILNNLGYTTYTKIYYPDTNIDIVVKHSKFWKELVQKKFEYPLIKKAVETIHKGDTLIDIGAWIGPYTLLFSKLVQETGTVHSFDPDPISYKVLQENIAKNNIHNTKTISKAISDKTEKLNLTSHLDLGKSTSTIINQTENMNTGIKITCTSLDEYCSQNNIKPNGIKIDVEGSEYLVIKGAYNTLNQYKPWILLEYHEHLMSENDRENMWNQLQTLNYETSIIDDSRKDTPAKISHIFLY